jgi:uncharacterized membrane protein
MYHDPDRTTDYRWLHALNALLLVALWAYTVVQYGNLPEQIPAHIGPSGVTRWTRRESGMWFMLPILGTFHALVMYLLSSLADNGASGTNTPHKKRLKALSREGQRNAMQPMRGFMFGMATWLLTLMFYVQYELQRVSVAAQTGNPATSRVIVITVLMTAALGLLVLRLYRSVGRRITEWEQQNPAA